MGVPAIFAGQRTKLLSAKGLLLKDGTTIDNDGVVNFIRNNSGANGTTGWTEGSYTAASRPSGTFTASSGAGAFAISTTTTTPLGIGTTSFLLTKSAGASRQGRAVVTDWALPISYRAKVLKIDINYIINSGTFVAGSPTTDSSLIWYCAFSTDSGATYTVAEPSSFKLLSNSTTISDRLQGYIQTPSNATNMRIIAYVAETANSAWVIECITKVSPSEYVAGTIIEETQSYTGSLSYGGTAATNISSQTYKRTRIGDRLFVSGTILFNGPANGNGAFRIPLPSGVLTDTTKIASSFAKVGDVVGYFNSNKQFDGYVRIDGNSTTYVTLHRWDDSGAADQDWGGNTSGASNVPGGVAIANGDGLSFNFSVPILGWSAGAQMSDGYDGRTISFIGSAGSGQAVIAATTNIAVTASKDSVSGWTGSTYVVQSAGDYLVTGAVGVQAASSASGSVYLNGVIVPQGFWASTPAIANSSSSGATLIPNCKAGDIISVRSTVTSTISQANINIFKLSGSAFMSPTAVTLVRASNTAGTSIATGAGTSPVPYATVQIDTIGAWNGTTFTAQESGNYEVNVHAYYASASWSVSGKNISVLKNGSFFSFLNLYIPPAAYTEALGITGADTVTLNAGETITFGLQHNEAATRALSTVAGTNYISIKKVK